MHPASRLVPFLAISVASCVMPSATTPVASTHAFDPGVRVERLGPIRGEATRVCGVAGFVDENPDEVLVRQAIRRALDSTEDADAIVDAIVSAHASNYLLFSRCKVEVMGTAVRVNEQVDEPSTRASAPPADGV